MTAVAWRRVALAIAFSLFATLAAAQSADGALDDPLPRHPLELQALVDPEAVLRALPAEIQRAAAAGDHRQLALLHLARANACRVIADWACQRDAGASAVGAAAAAQDGILQVRGLIAESRGRIAMQDFTRGERLLGDAERLLETTPSPDLSADVYLAYSSLSYSLGKHVLAAEYADRGLAVLAGDQALAMQVRLLRNRARAQAQLRQPDQAQASLARALQLSERVRDPKLSAELYLEAARLARLRGDVAGQRDNGAQVLQLARELSNSQLEGQGHEVLGLAARDNGEGDLAERELRLAQDSFRQLGLLRDERRVLRDLVAVMLGRNQPREELEPLVARLIELEGALEQNERALAADDFDARLKYAQQEWDVQRLESEAAMAEQRESALAEIQRFTLALAVLSVLVLLVLGAFFVQQRRSHRRLQAALDRQRESEARYRMLAENSRDLVVRMRLSGQRLYVSPSVRDMLGMEPEELLEPRWDLVHPDDRARLMEAIAALGRDGGEATVDYRTRHRDGHYVWIEALARLVEGSDGQPEIVYSGRDVSERKRAEQALAASQKHLRAIADNIPALVAYVDTEERFGFANAFYQKVFGIDPQAMIGRTLREVRGEEVYARIRDQVAAALRGEAVSFEGQNDVDGRVYHFQANFVPDFDQDGRVLGFFTLILDITALKQAERELERLARFDSLTGLANRRYFEERLNTALARNRRHGMPVILLYLDLDHFKRINDTRGHAVGDAVLREFSRRLTSCVREGDLVARLGGDEFVVLIDDAVAPETAVVIARKLIAAMDAEFVAGDVRLGCGASIGIAYFREAPQADQLLAAGDEALYAAKAAGRNTYRLVER